MFNITARDFPPSPAFIDFLVRFSSAAGFAEESWHDQLSEQLSGATQKARETADAQSQQLTLSSTAQAAIARAYDWFQKLVTSDLDALHQLHERFRFTVVIGVPRSGGSYLIAELFAALGHPPSSVPAVLAHDGFPEAGPTVFMPRHNGWMRTMLTTAEYIAMAELFFGKGQAARIHIPKKLTKAIYAPRFFRQILSRDSELVVTVRHPLTCCISTYEKSGGLPADGMFAERSTIEHWIRRDLLSIGMSAPEIAKLDYFAAYIRYWEHYYTTLALSGLIRNSPTTVVGFGSGQMHQLAEQWHTRFGNGRNAAKFLTRAGLADRHPQWMERSLEAIERVSRQWQLLGLAFPEAALSECL